MTPVTRAIRTALLAAPLLFGGCASSTRYERSMDVAPAVSKGTHVTPTSAASPAVASAPVTLSASKAPQSLPVPLIELAGTPADIGTAHGEQLASNIRVLRDKY